MTVLIGCAGSSGSTLLPTLLNRHPKLFSGPELNLLNKEQLFEDWEHWENRVFSFFPFCSTRGWQVYRRSNLSDPAYGWSRREVRTLLREPVSTPTVGLPSPSNRGPRARMIESRPGR